ncbi:hypothetical protein V8D89_014969, partial [Ganoderma adspersum]
MWGRRCVSHTLKEGRNSPWMTQIDSTQGPLTAGPRKDGCIDVSKSFPSLRTFLSLVSQIQHVGPVSPSVIIISSPWRSPVCRAESPSRGGDNIPMILEIGERRLMRVCAVLSETSPDEISINSTPQMLSCKLRADGGWRQEIRPLYAYVYRARVLSLFYVHEVRKPGEYSAYASQAPYILRKTAEYGLVSCRLVRHVLFEFVYAT